MEKELWGFFLFVCFCFQRAEIFSLVLSFLFFCDGPLERQKSDSMILVGPFQLRYSVIALKNWLLSHMSINQQPKLIWTRFYHSLKWKLSQKYLIEQDHMKNKYWHSSLLCASILSEKSARKSCSVKGTSQVCSRLFHIHCISTYRDWAGDLLNAQGLGIKKFVVNSC